MRPRKQNKILVLSVFLGVILGTMFPLQVFAGGSGGGGGGGGGGPPPLNPPGLSSPSNGATIHTSEPKLEWTRYAAGDSYQVQVEDDSGQLIHEKYSTNTYLTVSGVERLSDDFLLTIGLPWPKTYSWRVRTYRGGNWSGWSDWWTFNIGNWITIRLDSSTFGYDSTGGASSYAFADTTGGLVFARAESAGLGWASATATLWGGLYPSRDGTLTVEATLKVKGFVISLCEIVGASGCATKGNLELEKYGVGHEEVGTQSVIFDGGLSFGLPPVIPGDVIALIYDMATTMSSLQDLIELTNKVEEYLGPLETRVVSYSWGVHGVTPGTFESYAAGIGVGASSASLGIGGASAVIVGYVEELKVTLN